MSAEKGPAADLFYTLPPELWFEIFDHFEIKDLGKLQVISKYFNFFITDEIFKKTFEHFIKNCIAYEDVNSPIKLLVRLRNKPLKIFNDFLPIIASGYIGSIECIEKALAKGANINSQQNTIRIMGTETALLSAVFKNHPKAVIFLLEKGADIFALSRYKNTVFHIAALYNNCEVLKILIEHEKRLISKGEKRTNNCRNAGNLLPIQLAKTLRHDNSYKLLSEYGKFRNENKLDDFQNDFELLIKSFQSGATGFESQFHTWLVVMNNNDFVSFTGFLNNPVMQLSLADVDPDNRENIIHIAVKTGNKKALSLLMKFIINIDNVILDSGDNISSTLREKIKEMINAQDKNGNTPLHYAVSRRDLDLVRIVFSNSSVLASLTTKNNEKLTPVELAEKKSRGEKGANILSYLTNDKRDVPDLKKEFGDIPFNWNTHINLSQFSSVASAIKEIPSYEESNDSDVYNNSSTKTAKFFSRESSFLNELYQELFSTNKEWLEKKYRETSEIHRDRLNIQDKLKNELSVHFTDYQIIEKFKNADKSSKEYSLYDVTEKLIKNYQDLLSYRYILEGENKKNPQQAQRLFAIVNNRRFELEEIPVIGDGWCTLTAIGIDEPELILQSLKANLNNNETIKRYLFQAIINNIYATDLGENFNISGIDNDGNDIAEHINCLHTGLQNDTVSFIELTNYLSKQEVLSAYIDYLIETKYVDENIAAACLSLTGKHIAAFHSYLGTGQLTSTVADDINLQDPNLVCVVFHPSDTQATAHYNILRITAVLEISEQVQNDEEASYTGLSGSGMNSPPATTMASTFDSLLSKAIVSSDFDPSRGVVKITFLDSNRDDLKQFQNELLKIGIGSSSSPGYVRNPAYSKSDYTYTISLSSREYNMIMDNKNAYAKLVSPTQSLANAGLFSSVRSSPSITIAVPVTVSMEINTHKAAELDSSASSYANPIFPTPIYPSLLSEFGIKRNKVTGPSVAKALKEIYKVHGSSMAIKTLNEFRAWAKKHNRYFNMHDIKSLSKEEAPDSNNQLPSKTL